jgi:hypothetical protein
VSSMQQVCAGAHACVSGRDDVHAEGAGLLCDPPPHRRGLP